MSASFRVLSHAEIESYLEESALAIHSAAWDLWNKHQHATLSLACLLGFSEVTTGPRSIKQGNTDVSAPLQKANNAWREALRNNHGIKEINVLTLFLPVGIQQSELDQTMLNDLSSFGSSRGDIAHSSSVTLGALLDPKAEWETVEGLLVSLKSLDCLVERELKLHHRQLARLVAKGSSVKP
jgi:hypothetical protein